MYKHPHTRTLAVIAASSLLATFVAHAGKGANYHKESDMKRFTVTGGATYLEPSTNGLDYVDIVSTTAGGIDSIKTHNIDPEFSWGYFLGFGYMIDDNGKYDVQATWAQLNSNSDESTTATGAAGGVSGAISSNRLNSSIGVGETVTAHTSQDLAYQVFDANLGQYHRLTDTLSGRIFAGVRYAKIDLDTTNRYTGTALTDPFHDIYESRYSGVGPELGVDVEYSVYDTLTVVASLAGAFLIGNQDTSSDVFTTSGEQTTIKSDDTTRMVPGLNGKLGANWEIPYGTDDWDFAVEAGYQVAYYFDVVDQVTYDPGAVELLHNYANVGMMGPYLNFSAMF